MPDYTGPCIRDEFEGEITLNDLDLPKNIVGKLTIWHRAYREIIPLSKGEKRSELIK